MRPAAPFDSNLTANNIDRQVESYISSVEQIGNSIDKMTGLRLLEALKRAKIDAGPYPNVTLFEAANRIMTDLVTLYGTKWLLTNNVFPFHSYLVECGHESKNGFDIRASESGKSLIGEVFNVARSFFQGKKAAMLRKIRTNDQGADFKLIMFNHDAVSGRYRPKGRGNEYHVLVNVGTGAAETILPPRSNRTAWY